MTHGNATRAAKDAGYSAATAASQASRLLRKVKIRKAVEARVAADPCVWTREDRQKWWTAVASGRSGYEDAPLRDRLKGSERFLDGHARANRQKPSVIAAKETIGRIHLVRMLGTTRIDAITTEKVAAGQ